MANINLNGRVTPKTDTAENWVTNNPTLLNGEIGIESDTGKIKIGDGDTPWVDLSYREVYTSEEKSFVGKMVPFYSFVPTLIGVSNTAQYLEQSGTFTITGNMVQCQFYIRADVSNTPKNEDTVLGIKLNGAPVKSVNDTSFMGNFSIAGFGNINMVYAIMQSDTNIVSLTVKATDNSSNPPEYFTNIVTQDIEEDIIEIWGSATYIFDILNA